MPRLRDVSVAIRKEGFKRFSLHIWRQITEDNVLVWASSLAYSWLFALFPFLIFLLTLLPYVPEGEKHRVLDGIENGLRQLPTESAGQLRGYVDNTIRRVLTEKQGGLMSVGIILTLWAASGGMAATMTALDRCYDIEESRPFWVHRPLALLLTVVAATLMLLVVIILPIGGIVLTWLWTNSQRLLGYQLPESWKILLDIVRWTLGLFLLMMALNVVYHFGCRVRRKYRFLTPGAVFCILAWVAMGLGFRLYVDRIAIKGYNQTYGAVGGIVILMFLFYLSAIILLIGAELNSEIDYATYRIPRGTRDFRPFEKGLIDAEGDKPTQPQSGS